VRSFLCTHGDVFYLLFLFTLFIYLLSCDLRFLFGDHFGEFDFALVSGFGVDVELLSLSVRESWIEAAFPKVIIDLIDTSGARLTDLSRDGLGMGLRGLVRCV